ncbi:mitofissin NDAI_0F00180 [Naumovozyma dairenensis CBS 421]|uniref:DUF1748-domain-containing protein n=1 Tax=Naumovozyma dairenensis (strain ATCC 10597 / BCRC 20456 / CBS 421 / NBRC 0211 / NRRL Y-12639) TaxID=1071378 RepID=G0WC26_NAUDC|nr:hypothetical protein NDAI_0F00180 [Naumovozyma dairenensis CBS 421]CCD25337.1 hypothetical protein NDAI_0F00180 [Naumovozyma dairenensis CBS 421]
MTLFGKAVHVSIDLVLVSTCLAGIKRNTGLSPNLALIESQTAREYTRKYLRFGESVYDYSVASCGTSKYFERK